ncbi:MAG: DUF2848 family protein [Acidimicrobiia bacterium]
MKLVVEGRSLRFDPEAVIVAGFTGRDRADVQRHLNELVDAGVSVPGRVPAFYVVPPSLVTQGERVSVTHGETSGEVEIALAVSGDCVYLTTASDHTDRRAETDDIHLSKLLCPKVVAEEAWRLEDVEDHWDRLELRSWIAGEAGEVLYQEGRAGALLQPDELMARVPFKGAPDRYLLLAGTVAALGGIRPSRRFRAELRDPVLGRAIHLSYSVEVLDLLARLS